MIKKILVEFQKMKKIRTIKYLLILILFLVFVNSIFYIEYNNVTKVNLTENDINKIKPNVDHSPIIINGNGDFTPSNGVTSGGGTYGNPYIIEDYTIDVDGPLNCIFINNTNAYFKIQNCTLINSGTTPAHTTIELNNVVLPDPLGPINPTILPLSTFIEISTLALTPPKDLLTLLTSRILI